MCSEWVGEWASELVSVRVGEWVSGWMGELVILTYNYIYIQQLIPILFKVFVNHGFFEFEIVEFWIV